MRITVKLVGITGHVQHNIRLADPDDEYVKLIRELNAKGQNKTEDDRKEIERLEFLGGLYHEPDIGVYVPAANLLRCMAKAGTITKRGKKIEQAISPMTDRIPLSYDGPRKPDDLFARPEFRFRMMVGIQRNRVVRMRPVFRQWSLDAELDLQTDVLSRSDFEAVLEQAGRAEGLGEARRIGMGRFMAETKL